MEIRIDPTTRYQTFSGFGASGAWWAQEVGGWENKEEISRLLFDPVCGIGLTTYRYNLGAGSKESGRGDIPNPLRRAECFETAPGVYDFEKDKNAVAMLRQAVRDGASDVVFFVNSPPERLTKSGMAHCSRRRPFLDNLPRKNIPAFVSYCLDVCGHFIAEGIPVRELSPVNEPLWVWNGGQEGCHYQPWSVGRVMRAFAREMEKRPELRDLRLAGAENGDIRWFNRAYARQMLSDPAVRRRAGAVDVHSYFLESVPLDWFRDRPAFLRRFRRWMDRRFPGVPVRMSEWCHMQGGRDSTMASALVMANVMWEDLTILNVSAWQHWIAVSEVDYCDGLIYIDLPERRYSLTRRYYVTGNFSRYIPVGAVRIAAHCDDPDVKVVAFTKDGKTALVAINNGAAEKTFRLPPGAYEQIVTDDERALACVPVADTAVLPPRSVSTLLFQNPNPERTAAAAE